MENVICWHTER